MMIRKWKQIIQSLELPFDPTDEKSNRDNIVSALLNLAMLITLLYLAVGIIRDGYSTEILMFFIMISLMIISQYFIRKGKTESVSLFLVSTLWIFFTVLIMFFENGLRAPAYLAVLMFFIVYVGLLHGKRAVIVISTISVLVSIIVAVMEMKGIFLTAAKIPDIRFTIIAQVIFLPAVAFLVVRTIDNLNLSISLYRNEAEIRLRSEQNVKQLNQELEQAYETTLEGWARALELRDKETEGHSRRVTDLTIKTAKKFDFDDNAIRHVYYGALLHDIGKMGIPDEILNKPGALTLEEREIIKKHPKYAFEMLKDIEYLQPAISIPYSHHENWDGTGYPQGIQGEEIPLSARIFSVVDNWDALTSDRPYRAAWPKDRTIDYLKEQSGKKFDPRVVDVFINEIINNTGIL